MAMRGDACTRRRREARVGTEEEEGAESAAAEGVAPEGSAEAGGVLEAQEAPSWLQPCRDRACRHLRITEEGCMRRGSRGSRHKTRGQRGDVTHSLMRSGFPHPGIQLLQEYAERSCSLLV